MGGARGLLELWSLGASRASWSRRVEKCVPSKEQQQQAALAAGKCSGRSEPPAGELMCNGSEPGGQFMRRAGAHTRPGETGPCLSKKDTHTHTYTQTHFRGGSLGIERVARARQQTRRQTRATCSSDAERPLAAGHWAARGQQRCARSANKFDKHCQVYARETLAWVREGDSGAQGPLD